jgi:hypothetical protein
MNAVERLSLDPTRSIALKEMEGVDIPGYFIVEFNGRKVVAPRPGPLEYHVRSSCPSSGLLLLFNAGVS